MHTPHRILTATAALTTLTLTAPAAVAAKPTGPTDGIQQLERAHAHNDYEHDRPLFDALDRGFRSVEADVWLVDGDLCIGHDFPTAAAPSSRSTSTHSPRSPARTAARSTTTPPSRCASTSTSKDGGQEVWEVLSDQLDDRPQLITSWVNDREITRAVEVVVSGQLANQTFDNRVRWATGDGRIVAPRPADATSADLVVLSDNWNRLFAWQGIGPMPEAERQKLQDIVDEAHAGGYEVRFWATPDTEPTAREAVWRELVDADVDQLNTDHLPELETFLKSYDPTEQ